MTNLRTKQQINCDGVKVVWYGGDTFTEILQQQVDIQFSMDGVIPLKKIGFTPVVQKTKVIAPFYKKQKQQFVRSLDGIRTPWKEALAA